MRRSGPLRQTIRSSCDRVGIAAGLTGAEWSAINLESTLVGRGSLMISKYHNQHPGDKVEPPTGMGAADFFVNWPSPRCRVC